MNKKEFILKLKESLIGMDQSEKREILLDYEEHFLDGLKSGRSEQEICDSLGDPKEIAKSLMEAKKESSPKSNTAAYVLGIIGLSIGCIWLINIIFGIIAASFGSLFGILAILTLPFGIWATVTAIAALLFSISILALIIIGLIKLIILICRWYQTMINGLRDGSPSTREFKMFKPKAWIWILLAALCVLSLFVMIFGGIRVATNVAYDYSQGEYDEYIEKIEEKINDEEFIRALDELEDLERMEALEALEHLDRIDFEHIFFRDMIKDIMD